MKRAAPEWLTARTYAHRGMHSHRVPENSRAAAMAAIEAGLGIECDVQMSGDNVPLVFHDWELDRLTSGHGPIARITAAEACALTLLETDQTIWPLAELLASTAGRVPLLIEIKARPHIDMSAACAAIADIVGRDPGPVAVMSFDHRVGEWFARHAPDIARGFVVTDTLDHGYRWAWRRPHAIERAAPDFLAADVRDLPNAFAALWRETGRPLLSWTVRTPDLAARAAQHADAAIAEGAGLA